MATLVGSGASWLSYCFIGECDIRNEQLFKSCAECVDPGISLPADVERVARVALTSHARLWHVKKGGLDSKIPMLKPLLTVSRTCSTDSMRKLIVAPALAVLMNVTMSRD